MSTRQAANSLRDIGARRWFKLGFPLIAIALMITVFVLVFGQDLKALFGVSSDRAGEVPVQRLQSGGRPPQSKFKRLPDYVY